MADYMSRNEVINRLQEIANDYEDARDMDAFYVADYCLKHIMELRPAADVRPVVHGHYIGEYDGYADGNPVYDMWYCSECGCLFEDWDEKPTYNFCPNCGADMRPERGTKE